MTEAQHTPGSHEAFSAHPDDVIDHEHSIMGGDPPRVLALLNLMGGTKADLRMWAAAPDLLEALKAVKLELFWCATQLGCNWKDAKWRENSSVGRAFDRAAAAIAKAEPQP